MNWNHPASARPTPDANEGNGGRRARAGCSPTGQLDGRKVTVNLQAAVDLWATPVGTVINDGENHYWFDLPMRARPKAEDEQMTEWWPAPGHSATADIHGNGGFQIRYRVMKGALVEE